jgi:DNA/RNA-binding domain of Phe-tRNA-synthetase-like protein
MRDVANPELSPELERRKATLERDLRSSFASPGDVKAHPLLAPYAAYYKRFGQTYHVQHQLESVALRGKSIPRGAALVEAMFMAELKNLLLTAGHDRDSIRGGLAVDVAGGTETYTALSGTERVAKPGDMLIRDDLGILSSILYGPDRRTRITPTTTRVLFTVYAPAGILQDRVRAHLNDLTDFVLAVSPAAGVEIRGLVDASPAASRQSHRIGSQHARYSVPSFGRPTPFPRR